jgi:hypothetical protein
VVGSVLFTRKKGVGTAAGKVGNPAMWFDHDGAPPPLSLRMLCKIIGTQHFVIIGLAGEVGGGGIAPPDLAALDFFT